MSGILSTPDWKNTACNILPFLFGLCLFNHYKWKILFFAPAHKIFWAYLTFFFFKGDIWWLSELIWHNAIHLSVCPCYLMPEVWHLFTHIYTQFLQWFYGWESITRLDVSLSQCYLKFFLMAAYCLTQARVPCCCLMLQNVITWLHSHRYWM